MASESGSVDRGLRDLEEEGPVLGMDPTGTDLFVDDAGGAHAALVDGEREGSKNRCLWCQTPH